MLCLISGRGFLYLTDSHLYSIPQVLINDWRDNIFCPVVMVLIDSDVFLITENLSEGNLLNRGTKQEISEWVKSL